MKGGFGKVSGSEGKEGVRNNCKYTQTLISIRANVLRLLTELHISSLQASTKLYSADLL